MLEYKPRVSQAYACYLRALGALRGSKSAADPIASPILYNGQVCTLSPRTTQ